ncbi:unnamed protein product [Prorocentrum cordatum]|uniref:Uncharacterized protein n=1 Tax=Prorocentrum cordatum TaxID=2364126 RepID=A0ABN9V0M3_9DINO|nr:unnamed protein product [Polarella glacialis]
MQTLAITVAAIVGVVFLAGVVVLHCFVRPVVLRNIRARASETPRARGAGPPGDVEMGEGQRSKSLTMLELHISRLRRRVGNTPERQELAREALKVAVKSAERGALLEAVSEGYYSGLPVRELEDAMRAKVSSAVLLNNLAALSEAIEECRSAGLAEEDLRAAEEEKGQLEQILARLREGTAARDTRALAAAIGNAQQKGLVASELREAEAMKAKVDELIDGMRLAVETRDVQRIDGAIERARAEGLPSQDLAEAALAKTRIEELMARLQAAVDAMDLEVLVPNLEECQTAGLPAVDLLRRAVDARAAIEGLQRLNASCALLARLNMTIGGRSAAEDNAQQSNTSPQETAKFVGWNPHSFFSRHGRGGSVDTFEAKCEYDVSTPAHVSIYFDSAAAIDQLYRRNDRDLTLPGERGAGPTRDVLLTAAEDFDYMAKRLLAKKDRKFSPT